MSKEKFIPANFKVPKCLETGRVKLRMLQVNDLVKDFDAIMSSVEYLQSTKPFGPNQKWPTGLTLEQNLIDIGWHQKEFQMRSSFAYTVMNIDESECLGTLYIDPTTKADYDAQAHMWVRQSELANGLDEHLFDAVKEWLNAKWPFEKVAYPGREINWDEWEG